jgi:hypothetical protein
MKVENKIYDIISNIWSNLDIILAGFDYSDAKNFEILKLIFHFLFFGLLLGLLARYSHRKEINETESASHDTSL